MGRFEEIVGHGDYETAKLAPDPFLKAAERLGVEPRSGISPSKLLDRGRRCDRDDDHTEIGSIRLASLFLTLPTRWLTGQQTISPA
jgi:hypothetical protein